MTLRFTVYDLWFQGSLTLNLKPETKNRLLDDAEQIKLCGTGDFHGGEITDAGKNGHGRFYPTIAAKEKPGMQAL